MKTIVSLIVGLAMTSPLMAVEYVTLSNANPTATTKPTDVVQIMTCRMNGSLGPVLDVDGLSLDFTLSGSNTRSCEGVTLHGVTNWSVSTTTNKFMVVLRITKPNEAFTSDPLVVPVAQGTSYAVALETSTDMQTWFPANPGDYVSTSSARFFRVKAAVSPGAP